MKINRALVDDEHFVVRPVKIAGEICDFVFPKNIGAKWNKDNLIYRSSIWNSSGELISASFKKFFNYGEHPELASVPTSFGKNSGVEIIEKIDGSTLIFSKYKNELIIRTRGCFDPESSMDNGFEITSLRQKYPQLVEILAESEDGTCPYSLIFEWVSPINKIVISYPAAELYLTALIYHDTYRMASQKVLDNLAIIYGFLRPRRFNFDTFEDMCSAISALDFAETKKLGSPKEVLNYAKQNSDTLARDFEGFCAYKGQGIFKIKSAWYLALHKLKSELGSFEKVLDLWMTMDCMPYQEFYNYISEKIDFEVAEKCRGDISKLCDAKKEVDRIIAYMEEFTQRKLDDGRSFKDAAKIPKQRAEIAKIVALNWGNTNRAGFVFTLLDGKPLSRDQKKKLIYQVMK